MDICIGLYGYIHVGSWNSTRPSIPRDITNEWRDNWTIMFDLASEGSIPNDCLPSHLMFRKWSTAGWEHWKLGKRPERCPKPWRRTIWGVKSIWNGIHMGNTTPAKTSPSQGSMQGSMLEQTLFLCSHRSHTNALLTDLQLQGTHDFKTTRTHKE